MYRACKETKTAHPEGWPALSFGLSFARPQRRCSASRKRTVTGWIVTGWLMLMVISCFPTEMTPPGTVRAATVEPVEPFLARPFAESDLNTAGSVSGRGEPASDGLDYDSSADKGVNSYFDHQYPSNIAGLPGGFYPDNAYPSTFVAYRGRVTPTNIGWERGYSGHNGIDFDVIAGRPVLAAAGGAVVTAGPDGCGNQVIIQHPHGYRTYYTHMAANLRVQAGQSVGQGQPIGQVGQLTCTGPHLHFGLQLNGQHVDPFGFCPDLVTGDPWEARSGAPSLWLWQGIDSPCRQQHPDNLLVYSPEAVTDTSALSGNQWGLAGTDTTADLTARPNQTEGDARQKLATTEVEAARTRQINFYRTYLHDPDSLLQQDAVSHLLRLHATEAIPDLLTLLHDPHGGLNSQTRRALVGLGATEAVVNEYRRILAEATDPALRALATIALTELAPGLLNPTELLHPARYEAASMLYSQAAQRFDGAPGAAARHQNDE